MPDTVSDEIAVFTEPLAAAFRIPEQIEIASTDRIVILGAGKLGQLIAQVLYTHSKNLLCIGKNQWRLEVLTPLQIPTAQGDDARDRGAADGCKCAACGTPGAGPL